MLRLSIRQASFALSACALVSLAGYKASTSRSHIHPDTVFAAARIAPSTAEPNFILLDRQAELVKQGSEPAIRSLSSQFFADFGIRPEIATAYSFNERLVQAEIAYRHGSHPSVREADVVKSINNLVSSSGAPPWAATSTAEVRKLRMLLVIRYPHLMASEAPPDEHGRYKALDDTMSPLEATYVAGSMIHQKLLNPEFQFTDEEKAGPAFQDQKTRSQESAKRTFAMRAVLSGQSSSLSVRDLLHVADGFFTDLHVDQIKPEGTL
jgi:hypothetical protein